MNPSPNYLPVRDLSLAPPGLSYDARLFFPQLPELTATVKALPETTFIIDHCGGAVVKAAGIKAD